MTLRSPAAFVLLVVLAGLGCAVSEPLDVPSAGASGADATSSAGGAGSGGNGGSPGVAGSPGTAGTVGAAGNTGGAGAGVGGVAGRGGSIGIAGNPSSAGTSGRAGTTGTVGTIGAAGTGGVSQADGGTVTFTEVYTQVISQNCFGSGCHNPAGGDRPSFASQTGCYTYFKNQGQLYPEQDPNNSYLYFIMHGDPTASPPSPPYMPPSPNPHVSADDLALVAAWIADGALND